MRISALFVPAVCALLAIPARAEVAVVSGGVVRLNAFSAIDQACHSIGLVSVNVLEPPSAGTILVREGRGYPDYPTFNTRSRCNTLKLPQVQVSYQSAPGFRGYDRVVLELIGPLGRVFRQRYLISVR